MHRTSYSKELSGEPENISYVSGMSRAVKPIEWNGLCIEPYELFPFVMVFLNRNLLKDFSSDLVTV